MSGGAMSEDTYSRGHGSLSDDNAPAFEVIEQGICWRCARYDPLTITCAAFPQGIPKEILNGEFIHTQPYPGDNGILFEPKAGEP
jgi:hypothetical protein